jgi:hypothetical protein
MADEKAGSRLYGTPAPEKQLPPATQGLRGEGTPLLAESKPEQTRPVNADGQEISVAETSGTASAESKNPVRNVDHR